MIDVQLLRLRYEILNIPLEDLAAETKLPLGTLRQEALEWTQWWPDESALRACVVIKTDASDDDNYVAWDDDPEDPALSVLEEGAQKYLSCTRLRLQVFQMAKEVLFAGRYAILESKLIETATTLAENTNLGPQDLKHVSAVFKDIVGKTQSGSFSMGMSEDGMPTVIIRDLTGR